MIWKKQPVGSKLEALNAKIPTGNVFDEILIPAGSDINNYRTAGTFIVQNDSTAAQISNMPRSASGRLIVMNRTTSSYIVQEYYPTTVDPIEYVRNYNNGTWTNWEQIALNSKLTPTNGSGVKKDIVSSTERTGYRKCGNVTVLDLHFTMGSTAPQDESTSLLSGFPHATLKTRFMAYVINTTPRKLVRLTIDTDGNLTNCWDVLEQGNQIVATASYICEE